MNTPDSFEFSEQQQQELFKAETTWFHVFKSMIDSGDVAKMGPYTTTVYLVIKAHTNFSTGRSFPAIGTIASKAGISEEQVKRSLKTLEAMGYITKERHGRNNVYCLREKIEIRDDHGRPAAVATWDYLPSSVGAAMADLKNVLLTGDIAGAKIVHIDRLNIQIANGDNNTLTNMGDITDPELRASIEALIKASKNRP